MIKGNKIKKNIKIILKTKQINKKIIKMKKMCYNKMNKIANNKAKNI